MRIVAFVLAALVYLMSLVYAYDEWGSIGALVTLLVPPIAFVLPIVMLLGGAWLPITLEAIAVTLFYLHSKDQRLVDLVDFDETSIKRIFLTLLGLQASWFLVSSFSIAPLELVDFSLIPVVVYGPVFLLLMFDARKAELDYWFVWAMIGTIPLLGWYAYADKRAGRVICDECGEYLASMAQRAEMYLETYPAEEH